MTCLSKAVLHWDLAACMVDCSLTDWQEWSACSVSCGPGKRAWRFNSTNHRANSCNKSVGTTMTTPFALGLFGSTCGLCLACTRHYWKKPLRGCSCSKWWERVQFWGPGCNDAFLALTTLIRMDHLSHSSHSLVSFAFEKDQLYEKKLLECNWCGYSRVFKSSWSAWLEVKLKFQGSQGISYGLNSFGRNGLTTSNSVLFVFQMLELQYNDLLSTQSSADTRHRNWTVTLIFMILYVWGTAAYPAVQWIASGLTGLFPTQTELEVCILKGRSPQIPRNGRPARSLVAARAAAAV